jgi:multimeric flavodoxin WrbA
MKIAVISGSSRNNGNTEWLAEQAVQGYDYKWFKLREKQIQPIHDLRHDPNGFQPVDDDYDELIKEILEYDILVFATPIYWYGLSGYMKNFIDRWSQSLRDCELQFKERLATKKAYLITCGGDQPKIKGLPLVQQFQYICQFIGMEFAGYVIGQGNAPQEVQKDTQAVEAAKGLIRA